MQGTQAWITQFYLQLHQCLPLPHKCSPDGASPDWGCGHIIAAYNSFIYPERMKGWVSLIGWPTVDSLPHKWSPVSCRSSAGQGKFASQRPTFYQPTNQQNLYRSRTKIVKKSEALAMQNIQRIKLVSSTAY